MRLTVFRPMSISSQVMRSFVSGWWQRLVLAWRLASGRANSSGLRGIATRLGTDPLLRAQIVEAVSQLQKARRRAQKKNKSHRSRDALLVLAGAGMVVAAVPKLRVGLIGKVRRAAGRAGLESVLPETVSRPATVEQQIEVNAPVAAVYKQWTQFEQFPSFMEGVDEVKQLDDTLLHWAVTVSGKKAEWDAKITANDPDQRIAWESVDGKQMRGSVTFEPLESGTRTRIRLQMSYTAQGTAEAAGAAVGLDERRVRGDLERFRDLVEGQRNNPKKQRASST